MAGLRTRPAETCPRSGLVVGVRFRLCDFQSPRPPASSAPLGSRRGRLDRGGVSWWDVGGRRPSCTWGTAAGRALLKQVNAGRPQPDGGAVDLRRPLRAEWTIEVPVVEGEKP